ncbi:SRPBCC family protein [Actinoplanes teichomyceticus]|uniref:Polyketide cyclase/dehydrase/lipid transport protein n=1 Tax=Actinoplanes teichomyceticus TaxID=1867 RepID=A0A561VRN3_ACTTI|nr:SRPBCC family protein [Actinoplanes teichomyceticus]TWG14263.1 polyketide cyclase/dehydrase/lipid transport protein [Actinoplanes teichomyceticus]GIF13181.1 polyketide cyclase [Actinoplanes teichomyceticus]
MATVVRTVNAPPQRVFAVLADGWSYSDWVVGTTHIREVEANWPEPGSKLHHKAGPWPMSLHDSSTVVACVPDRRLKIRAGLWPLGEAVVDIVLEPASHDRTRVVIHEDFQSGPLLWIRNKINDLVLHQRNVEALRRLGDIAEHRSSTTRRNAAENRNAADHRDTADHRDPEGDRASLPTEERS